MNFQKYVFPRPHCQHPMAAVKAAVDGEVAHGWKGVAAHTLHFCRGSEGTQTQQTRYREATRSSAAGPV